MNIQENLSRLFQDRSIRGYAIGSITSLDDVAFPRKIPSEAETLICYHGDMPVFFSPMTQHYKNVLVCNQRGEMRIKGCGYKTDPHKHL